MTFFLFIYLFYSRLHFFISGKEQVLLITLQVVLCYSCIPVSHQCDNEPACTLPRPRGSYVELRAFPTVTCHSVFCIEKIEISLMQIAFEREIIGELKKVSLFLRQVQGKP